VGTFAIAGLDPAIHRPSKKMMDARVKPRMTISIRGVFGCRAQRNQLGF
jgi:hypothetical protein